MRKKLLVVTMLIIVAIAIFLINQYNKPTSPAYILLDDILTNLGIKNVDLEATSIAWNIGRYETIDGKMMRLYRSGYSFKENSTLDASDIGIKFGTELVSRGFVADLNNMVEEDLYRTVGYIKGSVGCIIQQEIMVDDGGEIKAGEDYPAVTTVSCADDVLWKNKSSTTTPEN